MAQLPAMKDVTISEGAERSLGNEIGVCGTVLGNHQSAPRWIELLPAGDFAGRDGRGPFRLSNPAAVIAATDALRMDAGLPIDYDHATDFAAPVGRPAPAAGWIRAIEVRDGAIWGQVEWTSHGAAAVVTHEYRYISPVFEYSQDGEVRRLLRAALTNNPNLYLTAISARTADSKPTQARRFAPESAAAASDAGSDAETETDDLEAQLRSLLGCDEDSGSEEIIAKVRSLLDGGREQPGNEPLVAQGITAHAADAALSADPARYVPIGQFESALTELNRLRAASARERASYRVDAAMKAGKIVPAQREWAIAYCQANLRGFEEFVARQPTVIAGTAVRFEGEPSAGRLSFNDREDAISEGSRTGIALTRTELTICARLGLKPQDYLKRRSALSDLGTANWE